MSDDLENIKLTPLMKQYWSLKKEYTDYLLVYHQGDFYQLFDEDAIIASKILDIILTKKINTPMCGFPIRSCEMYFHKLIDAGFKVAVCDQLETPDQAKKRGYDAIVKRDVVRILTPGTVIEDELLDAKSYNYLACVASIKNELAISWLDISTGVFFYSPTTLDALESDIKRISPKELIVSELLFANENLISLQEFCDKNRIYVTRYTNSFFDFKKSYKSICAFYNVNVLEGIGVFSQAEISSCGALIEYIRITQKNGVPRLAIPKLYQKSNFLFLDDSAINSLEIFKVQSGEKSHSLISVIDKTKTSMGARLLRRNISSPFACHEVINAKLDFVEFWIENWELCKSIRGILSGFPDLERILSRILLKKCTPRDLHNLTIALHGIMKISELIFSSSNAGIKKLYTNLGEYGNLLSILDCALLENECASFKEGGFINPEYNAQLAELFYIQQNSATLIGELRDSYRKLTGINTLKINYNNVIGYYIEVSNIHVINSDKFIYRQSLSNAVRYTTSELKDLEGKIVSSKAASIALELEILESIIDDISKEYEDIALAAHTLAELDLMTSFAVLAFENKYTKPVIDNSASFNIIDGRHPVLEKTGNFIANDINLSHDQKIYLITGPNMAGKSTFLRQNALIAILAHIGSFVPAKYAHIGVIDKIFSRVGASDNISSGYSTFMLEMIETAAILNQSTEKSLVILDEVGRGTGVCDGLSIAWSVVEHLHEVNRCRSIFATHYYDLAGLENNLKHLKCFYMTVEEWGDRIVFLHKIAPGSTNKSYGIHVARLAGLPESVISRAEFLIRSKEKIEA